MDVTITRPNEDALIGLSTALSFHEDRIRNSLGIDMNSEPVRELMQCLYAANAWLKTVQHEIHIEDVAREEEESR